MPIIIIITIQVTEFLIYILINLHLTYSVIYIEYWVLGTGIIVINKTYNVPVFMELPV